MLGTIRFTLAILVLLNHLWLPTANKVGAIAVISFYIVSGFLMTMIIQDVYGPTLRGGLRYLLNRALRIFPPYWFFLAVSAVLLLIFPQGFGQAFSPLRLPDNAYDLFRNVTLFDLIWVSARIVPPAWSLTVECFFYIAMVVLLSRWRLIAVMWFLASVGIHVYFMATGARFGFRYYPTYAASLFFSMGALVYFFRGTIARIALPHWATLAILPVFCAFPLIVEAFGCDPLTTGYYGAAALFVVLLAGSVGQGTRTGRADRLLGDLAFPIFLSHYMAGGLVHVIFGNTVPFMQLGFMCISLLLCLLISVVFARSLQIGIDRARAYVRPKKLPREQIAY